MLTNFYFFITKINKIKLFVSKAGFKFLHTLKNQRFTKKGNFLYSSHKHIFENQNMYKVLKIDLTLADIFKYARITIFITKKKQFFNENWD